MRNREDVSQGKKPYLFIDGDSPPRREIRIIECGIKHDVTAPTSDGFNHGQKLRRHVQEWRDDEQI